MRRKLWKIAGATVFLAIAFLPGGETVVAYTLLPAIVMFGVAERFGYFMK